jgi:hypothetical protein
MTPYSLRDFPLRLTRVISNFMNVVPPTRSDDSSQRPVKAFLSVPCHVIHREFLSLEVSICGSWLASRPYGQLNDTKEP